jgi:hypothetical protein
MGKTVMKRTILLIPSSCSPEACSTRMTRRFRNTDFVPPFVIKSSRHLSASKISTHTRELRAAVIGVLAVMMSFVGSPADLLETEQQPASRSAETEVPYHYEGNDICRYCHPQQHVDPRMNSPFPDHSVSVAARHSRSVSTPENRLFSAEIDSSSFVRASGFSSTLPVSSAGITARPQQKKLACLGRNIEV